MVSLLHSLGSDLQQLEQHPQLLSRSKISCRNKEEKPYCKEKISPLYVLYGNIKGHKLDSAFLFRPPLMSQQLCDHFSHTHVSFLVRSSFEDSKVLLGVHQSRHLISLTQPFALFDII